MQAIHRNRLSFFFQAEDGIRDYKVTGVQTCALPILTAVARDTAGIQAGSSPVSLTVNNATPDTVPPAVSLTNPADGSTVSATIAVSATASDDVGVVGVQFKLDGANLGAEITVAPYSTSF